jgi:hypothetical protein
VTTDILIWTGIVFCLSQSAMFSGLNLAFFSISRLQLEVEAKHGNKNATVILALREDSNFLLSTILWGNVSINVLLTLLSDSVLVGVSSFMFSSVAITLFGEIFPQAYFSRNALKVAAVLSPLVRFYQILLFPVAKTTALILDGWLGREGITYFRENQLKAIIEAHVDAEEAETEHVEGIGALNFLTVEEISVMDEGESLDPKSVIVRPTRLDLPLLPSQNEEGFDEFIKQVHCSGHKWVVFTSDEETPLLVIDADGFIRSVFLDDEPTDPYSFCHRPIVIEDEEATLGNAMKLIKGAHDTLSDEVVDEDVILVWTKTERRMVTGADILGHLLKGIGRETIAYEKVTHSED